MGLDINSVQFLIAARRRGVDFGDALTLGRQDLNVYPVKMRRVLVQAGLPNESFLPGAPDTKFAEPVFKSLGARSIASLDVSPYEGAGFVHDLNQSIGGELKQRFDLVYDGGTLEHIFNFPVALQNCMEMIRENGRFISHTCANNWCGHGFYQFSPELFYSTFNDDNGFEVERMVLHVVGPYSRWYGVASPQAIRARVEVSNCLPLQMLVQARRKEIVPLFVKMPQQSDFLPRWDQPTPDHANAFATDRSKLAGILPGVARLLNVARNGWRLWHDHSLRNRNCFKPVSKVE